MISEQGTIKVSTRLDVNVQKELMAPSFKIGITFLVIGAVVFAILLILDIASIFVELNLDSFSVFYAISLFLLIMGLFLILLVRSSIKAVSKYDKVNSYEFLGGYFIVNQTYFGETVITAKIYNKQVTRTKESKNYFFIYVDAGAYPILKSELNAFELNTIKNAFNKSVAAATVVAPPMPPQPEVKPQPEEKSEEVKNGDPFDDLK